MNVRDDTDNRKDYALEARQLTHRYPNAAASALDGLDLHLCEGEVFGLLGPNGAGKTTALSIMGTILRPTAGDVVVKGYNLRRHRHAIRRRIGLVPQEIALYTSLTLGENLTFFGKIHGLHGHRLHRRIAKTLAMVGLEDRSGERIDTFSGGMQRRANLAAGMLHDPALLFLDEPTVGVDPQSRHLIMQQIETLRKRGVTVLYTTHYMEEAQQLCARIAIMDHGRILVQGRVNQLLAQNGGHSDLGALFLHITGNQLRDR